MTTKKMKIEELIVDSRLQNRVEINIDAVNEYAESMSNGDTFPDIVVFCDSAKYYIADGFHRYHAYRKAGIEEVQVEVRPGLIRDAILFACGVNAKHGLRRTTADKRKAIITLLSDDEWKNWSSRKISLFCGVHHTTVENIRKDFNNLTGELASEKDEILLPKTRTYVTKHGSTAQMNTSAIGKSQDEEKPLDYFTKVDFGEIEILDHLREKLRGTKFYNNLTALNSIASLEPFEAQMEITDLLRDRKIKSVREYFNYAHPPKYIEDPSDPEWTVHGTKIIDKDVRDLKNDLLNVLNAYREVKSEKCRDIVKVLTDFVRMQNP